MRRRSVPEWKIEEHGPVDFEVFAPGNRRTKDTTSLDDAMKYVHRHRRDNERIVLVKQDGYRTVLVKESTS